jgi:hypothetical protein
MVERGCLGGRSRGVDTWLAALTELEVHGEVTMPLLGRRSRPTPGLLTGVISAAGAEWEVFFIGDGMKEPRQFTAATLTEAADQAAAAALAMNMNRPQSDAALQFAIYPWDYALNAPIYDLSGVPGQFRASDIQGSAREITAESLEGLVEALRAEPAGDRAMLRWERPFSALLTDAPDD